MASHGIPTTRMTAGEVGEAFDFDTSLKGLENKSMSKDFERELWLLKQIDSQELYRLFHQLQFQVLGPQWHDHACILIGEKNKYKVAELFGPRSPELPESYHDEILQKIAKFDQQANLIK